MNTKKYLIIVSYVMIIVLFVFGSFTITLFSDRGVFEGINGKAISDGIFGQSLWKMDNAGNPINIVFMVGDVSEEHTDTMILVNYNHVTNNVNLLTIPRDTRVSYKDGTVHKINEAFHAGGYKSELLFRLLREMLGIDVNYYVYINIAAVKQTVDCLGGVEFDVPDDLDYDDPSQDLHIHLNKGRQLLDGDKAEQLLRFRKYNDGRVTEYYDGSDINRSKIQTRFIKEMINQKANLGNLTKINKLLNIVFKNLKTDLDMNEVLSLASALIRVKTEDINSFSLPGSGLYQNKLWYWMPDNEKISEMIGKYFIKGVPPPPVEIEAVSKNR